MFESTGIVFFFSTTPWTKPSSFCRFCLLTTNCIAITPSNKSTTDAGYFFYYKNKIIYLNLVVVVGACGSVNKYVKSITQLLRKLHTLWKPVRSFTRSFGK